MSENVSFFRSFFDPYYLSAYAVVIVGMIASVGMLHVQTPTVAVVFSFVIGIVLSDVVDYLLDQRGDDNDD